MSNGRTYTFALADQMAPGVYSVRMNGAGDSSALRMIVR